MPKRKNESLPSCPNDAIPLLTLKKPVRFDRSALDLCEQRAVSTLDHAKRLLPVERAPFFDMADQSVRDFIRMQKRFLDLTLEYWAAYLDSITPQSVPIQGRAEAVDHFATGYKRTVDFAIQHHGGFNSEVDSPGLSASKEADAFQRGIDVILGVQENSAMKPSEVVNNGEFWSCTQ